MKRKLSLILVLTIIFTSLFSSLTYANAENIGLSIDEIANQQANLLIDTYGATSVQYALIDNGEITLNGTAGVFSKTENKALLDTTMYGIGSTSKMFITVSAMKLYEMGKLDIDKPIIKYLPEFEMADIRYKDITARMLMNHSSGLNGSTFINTFLYGDNDTYSHDNFLNELKTQTLKANPGEFSVYCNDGFILLEILVEKISGMPYTEFLDKYITKPLKIENTKTPLDDFNKDNLARIYNAGSTKALPNENVNAIGTGGIYSTASDLCKFSTVFTGKTKILGEKYVNMMAESEAKKGMWVEADDSIIEYGLGWDSVNLYPFDEYGIKAMVKGGDTIYYHTTFIVLPEYNLSMAVVSSGGASVYNQLMATNVLLSVLMEKGIISSLNSPKAFTVPAASNIPEGVNEYLGVYADSTTYYILSVEDNKLCLTNPLIPNFPKMYLTYDKENTFYLSDGSIKIKLINEENNKKYVYIEQYTTLPGLGQTAASMYFLQKLEENKISDEANLAWQSRQNKSYFLVNEKYTSLSYSFLPVAGIATFDFAPGYLLGAKIVDENKAVNQIQIPGVSGRDTTDYEFFTKNNKEYLKASGKLFISADTLEPVYAGNAICTIQPDGNTRWYYIDQKSADKTIKIEKNENSGFVIYDASGACVFNSVIDNSTEGIKLPLGGFIAFISEPGTVFNVIVK